MAKALFKSLLTFTLCALLVTQGAWAAEDMKDEAAKDTAVKEGAIKDNAPLSYVGDVKEITAKDEDTLVYLARDYNVGYVELIAANPGVDPWLPGQGTKLTIPTRHLLPDAPQKGLVINLGEMRLYAYLIDGQPPVTFPLGVGREGLETPTGTTEIVRKVKGPVWFPTARMREEKPDLPAEVGPGKENPLGTHALYLGWPEYLIHGTNRPYGIGRRVSSGCMRMYPEDIVRLYALIPKGTPVTVVEQEMKTGWIDGMLYLEIAPNAKQAAALEELEPMEVVPASKAQKQAIKKVAGKDHEQEINWQAVEAAFAARSGLPIAILNGEAKEQPATTPEEESKEASPKEASSKEASSKGGADESETSENQADEDNPPESKKAAQGSLFNS